MRATTYLNLVFGTVNYLEFFENLQDVLNDNNVHCHKKKLFECGNVVWLHQCSKKGGCTKVMPYILL